MERTSQGSGLRQVRRKNPRYVKAYTVKDKTFYYLRKAGCDPVALPGLPWSPEFMAAREAGLAMLAPAELGASLTKAGTVSAALVKYYRSTDWNDALEQTTRDKRRLFLEKFRGDFGDLPLRPIKTEMLQKFVRKIERPNMQKHMATALSHFLAYCMTESLIAHNPAKDIITAKAVRGRGFVPWSEEDYEKFVGFWPIGSKPRLALALYLNFAVRKSDVIRIGPRHIRNGELQNFQPKKPGPTGNQLTIPLFAETLAIIKATPITGTETYIVNEQGRPYSADGFGKMMRKWCHAAGVKQVAPSHGLRKLFLIRLAEHGFSTDEIMALSGHKNRAEIDTYVREANRKKLARGVVARLETLRGTASGLSNEFFPLDDRNENVS